MSSDTAGVIAPPPLLYIGALLLALLLDWARPLPIASDARIEWAGGIFALIGLALAFWGRRTLVAAKTNINPYKPTTTIVASGPFGFSRNPLYVSMTMMLVGLSVSLNTGWGLVLLIPVLLLIHFGVVLREERYLEAKFGEPYLAYRRRVRRYL